MGRLKQSGIDVVDSSGKALDRWVKGRKVNDHDGLYNFIMMERIQSDCFTELHEH